MPLLKPGKQTEGVVKVLMYSKAVGGNSEVSERRLAETSDREVGEVMVTA